MKNRGFTLVELLVVIVILGVLLTLAVPSIMSMGERMNEKAYDEKIELFKNAAVQYASKNANYIRSSLGICESDSNYCRCINGTCKYVVNITVKDLIESGELVKDDDSTTCSIKDPRDNSKCLDCIKIEILLNSKYRGATAEVDATMSCP